MLLHSSLKRLTYVTNGFELSEPKADKEAMANIFYFGGEIACRIVNLQLLAVTAVTNSPNKPLIFLRLRLSLLINVKCSTTKALVVCFVNQKLHEDKTMEEMRKH